MAENAVNEFAQKVVSEWRTDHPSENLIFSPLSIAMCFLLVYQGARGTTKSQIENVFGFDDARTRRRLMDKMKNYGGHSAAKMANRVYVEKELNIKESYEKKVRDLDGADLEHVDFRNAYKAAGNVINEWVREETEGMISEVIPPGVLNAQTALVAVSALYFKDKWLTAFSRRHTADGIFHAVGGDQSVPFMMLRNEHVLVKRVWALNSTLFKLPYKGEEFSMCVLLPNEDAGWEDVEKELASEIEYLFQDEFRSTKVSTFTIPKWEMELSLEDLETILQNLKLTAAFGAKANFKGITESPPLSISNVFHKAKIIVDEKGTKAAASTATHITARSLSPDFHVDRPFIYFIVDEKDGTILFQGTQTSIPTANPPRKGVRRVPPPLSPRLPIPVI